MSLLCRARAYLKTEIRLEIAHGSGIEGVHAGHFSEMDSPPDFQMNLCPRCILRVSGATSSECYISCQDQVDAWTRRKEHAGDASRGPGSPLLIGNAEDAGRFRICDCCLGLLHMDYTELSNEAKRIFESEGFVFNPTTPKFSLHVKIPHQIYIRQRAAEIYSSCLANSRKAYPAESEKYIPDIKKCFRILASHYLSQKLGLEYSDSVRAAV